MTKIADMIDFAVIFSITHVVLSLLGMSFNLLLIYLALFYTPKVIRSYATLIINLALTDFFACFFDLFVQQRHIPVGLSLGYVSNGFCKYFGPSTCYFGYSMLLHFLAHSLLSLLLSFSYRLYVLYKPAPSRCTLVLIIFIVYLPSLFQGISFLWAQDDPAEVIQILNERFPTYNLTGQCVSGVVNIIKFSALYTVFTITFPITPVYISILIMRKKIIANLNVQGVNLTKNTKSLHAQLLMALTYQAILPGFYFFAVASYVTGQLDIYNSPILEYFTFSCVIFIPLLSPIASLVFVTPYRQIIKKIMFKIAKVEPNDMSSSQLKYSNNSKTLG